MIQEFEAKLRALYIAEYKKQVRANWDHIKKCRGRINMSWVKTVNIGTHDY